MSLIDYWFDDMWRKSYYISAKSCVNLLSRPEVARIPDRATFNPSITGKGEVIPTPEPESDPDF